MPFRLASPEAILATCLPDPAPTEGDQPRDIENLARNASQNFSTSDSVAPASSAGRRTPRRRTAARARRTTERTSRKTRPLANPVTPRRGGAAPPRRRRPAGGPGVHRHRRPCPEHPGLIAGAVHTRPRPPSPPNQQPGALAGWSGQLFHGREERVHVQMQNPPLAQSANAMSRADGPRRPTPLPVADHARGAPYPR
jgi:hypothetical protein